jgi:hypothetical protein
VSDQDAFEAEPPHDCRITARCFREAFGFAFREPYDFATFRNENSGIDKFFELREHDPRGGEGGERVSKVKERAVFSLHCGKMRGATWFDTTRPPQGIVWLCSYERHDERFKGTDDAYDRFAKQETEGKLYPEAVDYKALELSRRIRDADWSSETAIDECEALLQATLRDGGAEGTVRGISLRVRRVLDDPVFIVVAVSTRAIQGELSGARIELTDKRFYLVAAAMKEAATRRSTTAPDLAIPTHEFPGGLRSERAFEVALEPR